MVYALLCFLRFIWIWKFVITEVTFIKQCRVCVQRGALYLTGGRTEKDRNLAIWDRGEGGIKSGQGKEIKVVTTLDEMFSFLVVFEALSLFLNVFLYFSSYS